MRIVFLSASGKLGGAERVLLDLLASLRAAEPEWELHVVAAGAGPLVRAAMELGVLVHPLPFPVALGRAGDAGAGSGVALIPRLIGAGPAGALWLRRLRALLRRLGRTSSTATASRCTLPARSPSRPARVSCGTRTTT